MIEIKKDIGVYAVWVVSIIGVGLLIYHNDATWLQGSAFLVALGLPSVFGKKAES